MTLSLYDVLSHLIPGLLVYLSLLYTLGVGFEVIPMIPASAIAYVLGFVVNALSSWSEGALHWSWGGKPSSRLLEGHSIWKVKMFEGEEARSMLLKEAGKENPANEELFQIAMRNIDLNSKGRITDFNSAYAFSRNIFVAIIICSIIAIFRSPNILFIGGAVAIAFVVWLRAKQRGYYFAREVLLQYIALKKAAIPKGESQITKRRLGERNPTRPRR